ncbi:MAG: response regulator [bacterium]|jgi:AmiR/NasT family two-component response regulator|nr:MAG: response regulator [bacterium]
MAPTLKVLLAEDEPLNALALRAQLETLGHQVIGPAADGSAAVELAREHPVDLAILDIRMPGLSGLEAARRIFAVRPVPIIVLTGYSDSETISHAVDAPVFHFLVKPVSIDDLPPAISVARSRFLEWRSFTEEALTLERKLENRAVIEQAKRVLMAVRHFSEPEAYRLLQRASQNRNQPMVEVARAVLIAQGLPPDDPDE